MGSETIAFDIWLIVLCINGGLLIVAEGFPDIPLKTPFDTSGDVVGLTAGVPSQIYNSTGITANLTSGAQNNSTIGGNSTTLNPVDTVFFPLAALWVFIQFVTGGFVFQVVTLFGFSDMFVFALQGVIGILFARMVVYWIWGR